MAERVYITASRAADADYYHSHRCASTSHSDVSEITTNTAANHSLDECPLCQRYGGGIGPQCGLAKRLADMDVDDVLGGDPA